MITANVAYTCASVVFAVIAVVSGLVSARYSDWASKVEVLSEGLPWAPPGTGGYSEPVDMDMKLMDMSIANMNDNQAMKNALKESGRLNHLAALLARGSAAASFVSALLGAIPSL